MLRKAAALKRICGRCAPQNADNKIGIVKVISMKNTVDNLSKSKVILMCGPAGAGKSTLAKKFESTGMTILLQ